MTATFDPAAFRAAYPEFADAVTYPDATLELWWGEATGWINPNAASWLDPLPDPQRQYALYILTAHIGRLAGMIAGGEDPGYTITGSTSKISVTVLTPPQNDEFYFWLTSTPYGLKLAAFLRLRTAGGLYFGGSAALGAYRSPGGSFWR